MHKPSYAAAVLAIVLAGHATAQTANQNAQPAATSSMTAQDANIQTEFLSKQTTDEWRGTNLIGTNVYGPDGKPIGAINELVVGPQGEVRAVVIGVGGLLGIGEKNVAVAFRSLKIIRKRNASNIDKITIAASKEQLQKAPKFVYLEANGAHNTTPGARAATAKPATSASGGRGGASSQEQ